MEWSPHNYLEHWDEDAPLPIPDIAVEHGWIWRAWHRLHRDRLWFGGGMGAMMPQGISFPAVVHWCEFHDYSGDMVLFLDECLHAMDQVFIADHQMRANSKN